MSDDKNEAIRIAYEDLSRRLRDVNHRELWRPMMSELLRDGGGVSACIEYLEAQKVSLIERIRESIDRLDRE